MQSKFGYVVIGASLFLSTACLPKTADNSKSLQNTAETNNSICTGNLIQTVGKNKVACLNVTAVKLTTNISEAELANPTVEIPNCPDNSQLLPQTNEKTENGFAVLSCAKIEKIFETTMRECNHKERAYNLSADGKAYVVNCVCNGILKVYKTKTSNTDKTDSIAGEFINHKYANCLLSGSKYSLNNEKALPVASGLNLLSEREFKSNEFEIKALAEGRLDDYYNSRINRGDSYGTLALSVIHDSSVFGKAANYWLKLQANLLGSDEKTKLLNGRTWSEFSRQVNLDLAHEHAKYIDGDKFGVIGLLSADQISEYHENYFMSLGLPAHTFGGSSFGFRTSYWCKGCDSNDTFSE